MKRALPGLVLAVLLPGAAFAHYPFCNCAMKDGATVRCVGGFSDGTSAAGVPFEVIGYDEQVIATGKSDAASAFEFPRPDGEFYLLFDAGPGHVVEIDHVAIH